MKRASTMTIRTAFYGIIWYHNINNLQDPTDNQEVKSMLECAKRVNSRPVTKKDILNTDSLIRLCDMFSDSIDVTVLGDLSMILLSYAGFLRFDEVSSLRCYDVSFFDDHIKIFI